MPRTYGILVTSRTGAQLLALSVSHLDPIKFLLHLVKGIVADLVAGAHDVNFPARCL
jgi:hypothetical protein